MPTRLSELPSTPMSVNVHLSAANNDPFSNYYDTNRLWAAISFSRITTKMETVFVGDCSIFVCFETRTQHNSRPIWIFEGRVHSSCPCGNVGCCECLGDAPV